MKKVFTYYQKVPQMPDQLELIVLWSESWKRWGWDPEVITIADARQHSKFSEYLTKIQQIPTVNPAAYEEACWLRWLAFAVRGGGWMSDFDVINRGFSADRSPEDELMVHDLTACPCLVNATEAGAQKIVDAVLACTPKFDSINDRPHWSDMYFFRDQIAARVWPTNSGTCLELGMTGWEISPVVHCSHGAVDHHLPRKRREDLIRDLVG